MKVRFLLDEHLSLHYVTELHRYDTGIDVLRVGGSSAPVLSTLDPNLLLFCEHEQRALVTENRSTMPVHKQTHLAARRHHWSIFKLRGGYGMGVYLAELQLIWEASEAEEWIDQSRYLPL